MASEAINPVAKISTKRRAILKVLQLQDELKIAEKPRNLRI